MSELKPCPFHNCLTCACVDEVDMTVKDWNTRPIEDDLRKRIAELEAMVDELVNIGDNLFDSLNPIAWKHEWLDKWWKLSSCRRGEREE